jgi:hypothetical protein
MSASDDMSSSRVMNMIEKQQWSLCEQRFLEPAVSLQVLSQQLHTPYKEWNCVQRLNFSRDCFGGLVSMFFRARPGGIFFRRRTSKHVFQIGFLTQT